MKKIVKSLSAFALAMTVLGLVYAANTYRRETVGGNQTYILMDDGTTAQAGSLKFGNDSVTPTLPTTSNGDLFGVKVPVKNIGAAVVKGTVLVSSNTGTAFVAASTTSDAKSVVGIADAAIASGAIGYMTVGGYALCLTSSTVAIGDVLVSSATTTGYAWANNSPAAGSTIGVAMSAGTAAGGLTLIRLK